jgi:UDPglucose 6-dehydrogenase
MGSASQPGIDEQLLTATNEEATEGADALVTCTEWKRFMAPNFDQLEAALRHKLIFDGRNLYDTERVAERVPARRGWGRKGAPTAGA